jgi:flagellar hook-associated protein 2
MSSVGSTLKAEGVDQHLLVSASAHAARQAIPPSDSPPPDEASISSAGRLRGASMVVSDVVQSLAQDAVWRAQQVQSSAPHQVQASSESASPGGNVVSVKSLASAQVTSTASFSSLSTVIGIGTLNIEMGTWGGSSSTFATNPNWPKASVSLNSNDNTLERVRDRINAAGVGVIAAVVSDATGSRLVLSARSTGADNGFRIQADPGEAAAQAIASNQIDQFTYDPAQGGAASGMQLVQPAQDAKLSVNGRALGSDSNVMDDSVTGLRLSLQRPTDAPVQLQVQPDDETIQRRMQSLAASSQDLMTQVLQPSADSDAMGQDARQAALRVLDTLKANIGGSEAAAWQAIGLSWDEQTGIRHQDVSWSGELKRQGQALFAALSRQLPTATDDALPNQGGQPAALPAERTGERPAPSTSTAAVDRNRQRLLDEYTTAAPASTEMARQDLAVS